MSSNNKKDIPKIRVAVRKRPMNSKEMQKNDIDIIECKTNQTLIVKELKNKVDLTKYVEEHHYNFDRVYDEVSTNENIYLELVRPMVESAFETKAKITCFAYGQTGSGKTYTMMGHGNLKEMNIPGLYLLCAYDLINFLEREEYSHLDMLISFYEIYCNKLFDLLNDRNVLHPREDGKQNICIVGLQEYKVTSMKEIMTLIDNGLKTRTTGITGANTDSSRSHAVLQITLKDNGLQAGKISFIDLAGSERAVDTIDTNKQTKIDGAEINKSLLALKECIRALDQGGKHTPFRGSKLTLVLKDSFVGNCKTLMIANISPGLNCSEHTLNTLRYADRVKELKKEVCNTNKDLNDVLMMPRQHNKTIKYEVDKKAIDQFTNNNQGMLKHINSVLHNQNNIKAYSSGIIAPIKKKEDEVKSLEGAYQSKYLDINIKSDEEYQKLNNIHEKLINEILQEEEDFISLHKEHIDDTVDIVKSVAFLFRK